MVRWRGLAALRLVSVLTPTSMPKSALNSMLASMSILTLSTLGFVGCAALGPGALSQATEPAATGSPTVARTPPITATGTITVTPAVTPTTTITETATVSPTTASTSTAMATSPPTVTATPSPEAIFAPFATQRGSLFGSGARVWGLQFMLEEVPDEHAASVRLELPRARQSGLVSVRTNIRWDRVEPQNTAPESFDWRESDQRLGDYSANGFDILVTLVAYPGWATTYQCGYGLRPGMEAEWRQFVREAARRYSRAPYRVAAWEIGNEPDGKTTVNDTDRGRPPEWGGGQPTTPYGGCWGDRAMEYAEFLRMAYEEIKAIDPGVLVTHGGLAYATYEDWFHLDFLDKLLAAGGGQYIDFLNYHWFPNVPGQPSGPERHRALMGTLDRHGQRKPVWITETYRLTYAEDPHGSQPWQIQFLSKELVEMLAFPEVRRLYWYGWIDFPPDYWDPTKPQRGLVRTDHSPKAGLSVLPYLVAHADGTPEDISTERVRAVRFVPRGGRQEYVIAWSRDGSPVPLELPAGGHGPAEAKVVTFPEEMLLAGQCCDGYRVGAQGGHYRFVVGRDSLFITLPAR